MKRLKTRCDYKKIATNLEDELEAAALLFEPVTQASAKLGEWNDIVCEAFAGSSVDASDMLFDAELWRCKINDVGLVRVRAQPSKVQRWIHAGPRQSSGAILLHLQAAGQSVNYQRGRSVTTNPGEATLCDPDRNYCVDFQTPYEMFVVELPVSTIVHRDPGFDLERFSGRLVDTRRSQLLLSFLRTAWSQRDCLGEDADWRDCVSRTSLDLAMRSISQADEPRPVGAPAALQRAVIENIRENLRDPDLRTSSIARALRISPRSVQSVFERLATTASGFILQKRLETAALRLIERPGDETITALAYELGFSDSAYFSRCFSARYGVSPRDYRQAGGAVGRR